MSWARRLLWAQAPPADLARAQGGSAMRGSAAASDARREIGEAALAACDRVELGKLLVAPMISAIRDQLARRVELLARLLQEPRGLGRIGQSGRRRARVNDAVQRREGFAPRQRKPRALERAIAEMESHRSGLGDLPRLVQIAPPAVPIADRATEGGTSEQAASDIVA